MGKRPKREEAVNGRRESNRMSRVEAAYVVESYLLKNHYHRSLAEFRIEAAPDLSSLKSVSFLFCFLQSSSFIDPPVVFS
jgi:hypothetical protein